MLEYEWTQVARLLLTSRALDTIEETELVPSGEVTYQFSAGGHELAQILLGLALDHPHDAASAYYRSRPFMLALGLTPEEALAATMARAGSPTRGRDIGVVFNKPGCGRSASVLPMSGAVGTQYTPTAGWAQSIRYRAEQLGQSEWQNAIAVALGGDGSVATNGFWAALTIATTLRLPMLFFIEDNGYAISVRGDLQTPGRNIAANLASFQGLTVLDGDGCNPVDAAANIGIAMSLLRSGQGPVLLRLTVPRLPGHSFTDNQAYKSEEERGTERARDPRETLRRFLIPNHLSESAWGALEAEARATAEAARDAVRRQAEPAPHTASTDVFFEGNPQQQGGLLPEGTLPPPGDEQVRVETPVRMNLIDAVRKTLEDEMRQNPRILVFGEDVGAKGGVHGATRGLQGDFGEARVFDTSLNEEGIIGRAIGMALAGLLPVPEIQFRKYLDPATEQANDAGTIRWRTANRFAAPMVIRIPVGFSKRVGDPWHSVSDESILAHKPGWRVVMPSNAQDAVGLLRTALRSNDPTYFLEHRNLLDTAEARRPYPGDNYAIPFGKAAQVTEGSDLTVVTWGAMVSRCQEAAESFPRQVEILDLRTIVPWDKEAVLDSVRKTARCLIVHEDGGTAGFGAEVAAFIAQQGFLFLDAPVTRLTGADCPVPYNRDLMNQVVPSVERIRAAMEESLGF
ncbi:MAG: pyruvate dehydrogenase [Ardenticatenales bacterium]|nr:pyruvate dehydrogenase [Ardenticatenales bacterium]